MPNLSPNGIILTSQLPLLHLKGDDVFPLGYYTKYLSYTKTYAQSNAQKCKENKKVYPHKNKKGGTKCPASHILLID